MIALTMTAGLHLASPTGAGAAREEAQAATTSERECDLSGVSDSIRIPREPLLLQNHVGLLDGFDASTLVTMSEGRQLLGPVKIVASAGDTIDELSDAQLAALRGGIRDQDGNGIPDSIDVRRGTAEDANHNGIIDRFDPDRRVNAPYQNSRWAAMAESLSTPYFWTAYLQSGLMLARFTVKSAPTQVELVLTTPGGRVRGRLMSGLATVGAHQVVWKPTDERGHLLKSGLYLVKLRRGKSIVTRKIEWDR